jgi:hypothetical protein
MFNVNGPPRGSNVTSEQSSYDIIFKDIIVKSLNRNVNVYPNPNNYTVQLNENITQIYKAELISLNVPAATDISVNLTSSTNRLYFSYNANDGYIKLQAGTYLNPTSVAAEIQRQFNIIVPPPVIVVSYNSNLNRYIFVAPPGNTLTFYPIDGTVFGAYTVQDSIGTSLKLQTNPLFNVTQAINIIDNQNGVLEVVASNIYGSYNSVNTTTDIQFDNTISSGLVLTDANIYLSLAKLNSNTIQFVSNENTNIPSNISSIFCEIPNNTTVSSHTVKTLLNQPCVWSSENFYNPPLSDVRKLEITWYNENGSLININEHAFTLRIYYLQKRNQSTAFSVPLFTYTSGTLDSIFQPK